MVAEVSKDRERRIKSVEITHLNGDGFSIQNIYRKIHILKYIFMLKSMFIVS